MVNIVLVEPEIPQNTGNIVRTAAATGARVHIVRPTGFEITDKHLKRAGLDYWNLVDIRYYDCFDEVYEKYPKAAFYFASTKSKHLYSEVDYTAEETFLVFGKETKGLPESLLEKHYEDCIRIPMISEARSLNLSNAVAVIVYEAMRQNGFPQLKNQGELTKVLK